MMLFKVKAEPLSQGIHLVKGAGKYDGIRFQFRVENDKSGMCIVDANRIIYMNAAGMQFANLTARNFEAEDAVRLLKYLFKAKKKQLIGDYSKFQARFEKLVFEPPSREMFLDSRPQDFFKDNLSAPYRLDLALTYDCDNNCMHCYVDESRKKNKGETLSTADFKKVIDKAVSIGIPHMIFTGGEPTLIEDLPELIRYANESGLVTGLNTNGCKLGNKKYAKKLADAKLDHVQITLHSPKMEVHDKIARSKSFEQTVAGIKNMTEFGVPVLTNTTLTKKNAGEVEELIAFIAELGLTKFAVNSIIMSGGGKGYKDALEIKELEDILITARKSARENEMVMIWYSPTKYCELNPMDLGLGLKRCTAAHLAMCVEPNGDVIPCQSYYRPLGNILTTDWEMIWDNELAKKLRDNDFAPDECRECGLWEACAGGCALEALESKTAACREKG